MTTKDNHASSRLRILVARTDRIGDVLLSTPVFTELREQYTDCHLSALVAPYCREAVEGHPALDEVLLDRESNEDGIFSGVFLLVRELRRRRFDILILLHPTFRLAIAGALAGIPVRVGTGYRAYSLLFNRKVFEHRKNALRHEVQYNVGMLKTLGIDRAKTADPDIVISENDVKAARRLLLSCDLDEDAPFVVLHPGSGGSARDWPGSHFAALGDRINSDGLGQVLFTGGRHEVELIKSIQGRMSTVSSTLAGNTSIKELAAILKSSRLCVANSTGPMHLSAAVGTPTVSLFCPIVPCSPTRWGPCGEGHTVLKPNVPACPACIGLKCEYYDCMNSISVESVLEAVDKVMRIEDHEQRER
ncbi:MAG: glycosyltransferase family 9 protein [Candidatus Latescibacteria bacterium]|jgi:lipopolysaccharide heptosyltransferase II|nr:glycosyltransferase family 9 protein [Candidatus Latescibacterota bacterium]